MGRLNSAATQVWLRETDLVDLTLATLPAYLRGEGHPVLADRIEAAGNDRAWELRDVGLSIADAAQEVEINGVPATIAAHYNAGVISVADAKRHAGKTDPLSDLRKLATDRATAEHALTEIRRLGKVKAQEARQKGASVADIGEAFGVSRQGAYDLLD